MGNAKLIRSQATLGFIFAFIAIAGLAIGLTRIWAWFNSNYAHREVSFQNSRLTAADSTKYTGDESQATYIDISGADTTASPNAKYQPLKLTENWVFKGQASGKAGSYSGAQFESNISLECEEKCSGEADYEACYEQCECEEGLSATHDALADLAEQLDDTAAAFEDAIYVLKEELQDCWPATAGLDWVAYYGCEDAGDLCTAQLAASTCCSDEGEASWAYEIDYNAYELKQLVAVYRSFADSLDLSAESLNDCCGQHAQNDNALEECVTDTADQYCNDWVSIWTGYLQAQISSLEAEKANLESAAGSIESFVTDCKAAAVVCDERENNCYTDAQKASAYCAGTSTDTESSTPETMLIGLTYVSTGRECGDENSSASECGDECSSECSLMALADNVRADAAAVDAQISGYTDAISVLGTCCAYEDVNDKISCITDAADGATSSIIEEVTS